MNRRDAELFYDGRIPPGVVDDTLPTMYGRASAANAVRVGRVIEKPSSVMRRMAAAMARFAGGGCLTTDDMVRIGFTKSQVDAYAGDALRLMLIENPTLLTVEWAA